MMIKILKDLNDDHHSRKTGCGDFVMRLTEDYLMLSCTRLSMVRNYYSVSHPLDGGSLEDQLMSLIPKIELKIKNYEND